MNGRRWFGLLLVLVGVVLLGYGAWRLLGTGATLTQSPDASAPTATASRSIEPSAAPPTATPVPPTATPVPPLGEADVRTFIDALVAAVQAGDLDAKMGYLHPATLVRYGNLACATRLVGSNSTFDIEVLEVQAQAAWDYVTDGRTTSIPDAWAVTANQTQSGVTQAMTLHFAPWNGTVRWFTDCGEPMQQP